MNTICVPVSVPLYDGQGNVAAIAAVDGAVVDRYFYTPEGAMTITDAAGQTKAAPSYEWRYTYRGGRVDGPGIYKIGDKEWDYLSGGTLEMSGLAYWSQQLEIKPESLSLYDRAVVNVVMPTLYWGTLAGTVIPNPFSGVFFGLNMLVSAGMSYAEGNSGIDIAKDAAFDGAVAVTTAGAGRLLGPLSRLAASSPKTTTAVVAAVGVGVTTSDAEAGWASALGKGLSNRLGSRLATRLATEVTAAERVLAAGGTGDAKWGQIYQRWMRQGKDVYKLRLAYGNAVQEVAWKRLEPKLGRQLLDRLSYNRGSKLGLRGNWHVLRPDLQVRLARGRYGVIDITASGSAGKALQKYAHRHSPFIREVLYELPEHLR